MTTPEPADRCAQAAICLTEDQLLYSTRCLGSHCPRWQDIGFSHQKGRSSWSEDSPPSVAMCWEPSTPIATGRECSRIIQQTSHRGSRCHGGGHSWKPRLPLGWKDPLLLLPAGHLSRELLLLAGLLMGESKYKSQSLREK